MHILRLVWDWPPPWNGLAPGPYDLTAAQQKLGNEVTVFTGGWPRRLKEKPAGVKVYRLPSGFIPGANWAVFFTTVPAALLYYLVYRIFNKVDVLHVHGHLNVCIALYKLLFGWLDKTPYVAHLHHVSATRRAKIYQEQGKPSLTTRLEWWLWVINDRLTLKATDKVVVVSESMKNEIRQFVSRLPAQAGKSLIEEKVFVLGNGVDTELFSPDGEYVELPWNNKKVLLFVGGLSKRKNPDLLVRVLPQMPDYAAVFIGTGSEEETLKQLADELHVTERVAFLGYVHNRELASYFRTADVFVLPSSSEGFPKVVLEALACGTPVVTSGFDPGDELGGMVRILDETSEDDLIQKIREVERKEVDVNFIQERYSWKNKAEEMQKLYDDL